MLLQQDTMCWVAHRLCDQEADDKHMTVIFSPRVYGYDVILTAGLSLVVINSWTKQSINLSACQVSDSS